jgi:hypothetical protein
MAHKVFLLFLVFTSLLAIIAVALNGFSYYVTPTHLRHFREDYERMKPSGNYSHGLGIVGASMIIIGVSSYSTRKRTKALWNLGKLSRWLEIHIFLCLLGPLLVLFHTTFKAGGVAAISLWTMLSVAASGIIGRFLYAQIPKNLQGNELTAGQITSELDRLSLKLSSSPIGDQLTQTIYKSFESLPKPRSIWEAISTFVKLASLRRAIRRQARTMITAKVHSHHAAHELQATATAFASLIQKSLVLNQAGKLFYYWHAIHLPFTVIMFITLAAHITVTMLLGYRWIF